jgi:hypothetical protein
MRELRFQGFVVKRFTKHAKNQELVLLAFEEQGWAQLILDPLPPKAGVHSKPRLRDTLTKLNRTQIAKVLRFHGDGSGRGVFWEAVPPTNGQQTANTSNLDRGR